MIDKYKVAADIKKNNQEYTHEEAFRDSKKKQQEYTLIVIVCLRKP